MGRWYCAAMNSAVTVDVTSVGLTFTLLTQWGEMSGSFGDSFTRSRPNEHKNPRSFAERQKVGGLIIVPLCKQHYTTASRLSCAGSYTFTAGHITLTPF